MVALLSFSNNLLDQRASNIVLFSASWVISCLWWWCDLILRSLSVCFLALWALMQQSLVQQQHLRKNNICIYQLFQPQFCNKMQMFKPELYFAFAVLVVAFLCLSKRIDIRDRQTDRQIKTVLDCTWSRLTINNWRSLWNVVLAAKDWRVQMKMMVECNQSPPHVYNQLVKFSQQSPLSGMEMWGIQLSRSPASNL